MARRRPVRRLLLAEPSGAKPAIAEIEALARSAAVPVSVVGQDRLRRLARTDAPQGVVALAEPLPESDLPSLMAGTGGAIPLIVVLDGVTDPGNLGALMRSALGAGATGIVLAPHRSARLTPAALKAAAGAAEHLRIAVTPLGRALAALGRSGIWTVGLDPGATESLWHFPVADRPIALVLGAEGSGLSRLVRQRCDLLVRVPTKGPLVSLNVAVAAALACFEVSRHREEGPCQGRTAR